MACQYRKKFEQEYKSDYDAQAFEKGMSLFGIKIGVLLIGHSIQSA